MSSTTPGSDRLDVSRQISKAQLAKVLTLVRGKGLKLRDWQPLGQPAPDMLRGSIEAKPADATRVINGLVKLGNHGLKPRIEVFPIGIVNPDAFQIDFRIS